MAEIAGVAPDCIRAWSQRSTALREWAANNLLIVDGAPTATQLAAAQKATRPTKPESLSWEELRVHWRADERGLGRDKDAHMQARDARRAAAVERAERARATGARRTVDPVEAARMAARIPAAAFTRADMVELLGAQLPVDVDGDPRALIEAMVDQVNVRITAPREAHEREGHERFTIAAVIAEEERVLAMANERDTGWSIPPPDGSPLNVSPTAPAQCSKPTTSVGTSTSGTPRPCTPLRA